MVKTIGYARCSTSKQDLGIDVQLEAFKPFSPSKIFQEQISGKKEDRKQLNRALEALSAGDTLLIFRVDRLGRSVKQLVNLESMLREKGINLKIINENIDTSTSFGRLLFNILASFAEMESENISIRTKMALAELKKKGKKLGNQGLDTNTEKRIVKKIQEGKLTHKQIALQTNVSIRTIYNVKKRNNL